MKPKQEFKQFVTVPSLQQYGQWPMIAHVAAMCRVNGYKFVTKKEATQSAKVATFKAAEQNALAPSHSVDVDQVDIDLMEMIKTYWANNTGPEYIASAQILKNLNYFEAKHLPTLSLLVCEYLRQLSAATTQFEKEYKANAKVKSFTESYKEVNKFMHALNKTPFKPIKINEF